MPILLPGRERESAMSRDQHILIIDQQSEVGEILRAVLETIGYRASCAPDAVAARCIWLRDPVDLVVADVALRSDAGVATANRLEKLGIPCLLMSADVERMEALEGGHHPFIAKPFRLAKFTSLVLGILAERKSSPQATSP
jgi:two-component system OmpR family response regulator